MDYEKLYKEAISRANKYYNANTNKGYREIFEDIFPELRESEDERIRNEIILYIGSKDVDLYTHNRWLAWLEKHGDWSEEDEEMYKEVLTDIIYAKNDLKTKGCLELSKRAMKAFNWFSKRYKSLRPQSKWKPSEEQLKALELQIRGRRDALYELFLDLREL